MADTLDITQLVDGADDKRLKAARGETASTTPADGASPALPRSPTITELTAEPPAAVREGYSGLRHEQAKEQSEARTQLDQILERDRRRIEQQYEATGVQPGEFQKWDADKETHKYETNPIQSFGSLGSVFGMIASAFSHAPMENALNASAAAMNAVRAGDQEGYERAHAAHKENLDLAFKRHELEREHYSDAISLLSTNTQAGEAKLRMLASRFNDQQALFMLDNGMSGELIDLQEKKNNAIVKAMAAGEQLNDSLYKKYFFEQESKQIADEPDPVKRAGTQLEAFQRIYGNKMNSPQAEIMGLFFKQNPRATAEQAAEFYRSKIERPAAGNQRVQADQEFIKRFYAEHPDATSEEFSEAFGDFRKNQQQPRVTGDQEFIKRFYEDHPEATVEDFQKAFGEFKQGQRAPTRAPGSAGGNTNLTIQRQNAQAVLAQKQKWAAEGMPQDQIDKKGAELYAQLSARSLAIGANRREQLEGHIDQFSNGLKLIDKVVETINQHALSVGLAGRATRMGERVGNIFGTNDTDRAQLERDIHELQTVAPQLLLDRVGRPLSAEAGNMNSIVAGLSLGDTTANTLRALNELKEQYRLMRTDSEKRLKQEWEFPSQAQPAENGSRMPWSDLPEER